MIKKNKEKRIAASGREHGTYVGENIAQDISSREVSLILDGLAYDEYILEPLSGEWADDPTPHTLSIKFNLKNEDIDNGCDIYENAYREAFWQTLEQTVRV